MSVLILARKNEQDVPTPPVGYVTAFVDSVTDSWVYKNELGASYPLLEMPATNSSAEFVSVLGIISDISTITSPTDGDKFLVGGSPVGILIGNTNKLVERKNGAWIFVTLKYNSIICVNDGINIDFYLSSGYYPSNIIKKLHDDNSVFVHELSSQLQSVEASFNSGSQITINGSDTVLINWINGSIKKLYLWVGDRSGKTWGSGSSNTSTQFDFYELPTSQSVFEDSTFSMSNSTDVTKVMKFDLSNILSGSLSTIIVPNGGVDLSKINSAIQSDGTVPFTQPISGVDAINAQELTTLAQVQTIVSQIGSSTFIYTSGGAFLTWNISHNLGRYPSVTVVDLIGNVVNCSIQYVDANTINVSFTSAFNGKAYIN